MKKTSLITLIFICLPLLASAVEYTLLEPVQGFLPTRAPAQIEEYLVGIFRLVIALAGVLAVIRITWCGFKTMMSTSPSAREEAKECVKMAIFGLLLAFGSFLIINSIRVGAAGGIGIQSPFTLPSIPSGLLGGPEAGNPPPEGSPVCTLSTSNNNPYEGQVTNISVTCTPGATGFTWVASNGAPAIQDNGGFLTFPTAGIYTYYVSGTNAAGTGVQSQILTIRVSQRTTQSCAEDMPQAVVGPITCTQTNNTINWSALGSGERTQDIVMSAGQSISVEFTTVGGGGYGSFTTRALTMTTTTTIERVIDPDADPPTTVQEEVTIDLPQNTNAIKFANISRAACDFRYENLDRNVCAVTGPDITLDFQVGGGVVPNGARPGCILEPNTAYVINVRNENPDIEGSNTCPLSDTCDFAAKLTQSTASQFTPEATALCGARANSGGGIAPSVTISNPANNTSVDPGDLPVGYTASDQTLLSSVEITVYNLDSGAIVDSQIVCTSQDLPDLPTPQCGRSTSGTATITVGPDQGSYRIVARACGASSCTTQSRVVTIANPCVRGAPGLRCINLPNTSLVSLEMCAPQNGGVYTVATSNADAHRFRLSPGESAKLIVANRPMVACPYISFIRFSTPPVSSDDYVFAMAKTDVWTSPGGTYIGSVDPDSVGQVTRSSVRTYAGYRWREVNFENTSGWVYEHLLKRVQEETVRGLTANDPWCSYCGMASTSLAGTCDYVRYESLNVSVGTTPGDTSGSAQFLGGVVGGSGTCSTYLTGGTGRFEITLKTSGRAGVNECVINPDTDYFVNVGSSIDDQIVSPKRSQEEYVILFGKIPVAPLPPPLMCSVSFIPPPPPVSISPAPPPLNGLPIIPGGSGFGITTPAGSGRNLATPATTVYRVTNLNDSGPGSLRACVVASGPRTCVFEISGIIALSSALEIRNPYITIAGQTAPSPGIMLTGNALTIQASDVLVQHIRVRPGDAQPPLLYPLGDSRNLDYNNSDALHIVGYPSAIRNVVIDHNSFGWSTDEMAEIWDNWDDVTFTNNIFANPLNDSYHNVIDTDEGSGYFPHGYGPIAGGANAGSVTFVGNVFANQEGRNPLAYGPESYIANNLIYNYNGGTSVSTHPGYPLPIASSLIGNVYIPGPNTGGALPIIMEKTTSSIIRVFLSDIVHPSIGADPWTGVRFISSNSGYLGVRSEFETVLQQLQLPGFSPAPSGGVESSVLSNAGARPADRDSTDTQVILGVRTRTGSVINCVAPDGSPRCSSNAGGWPNYAANTRPITLPTNPDADDNADGYTNLENWLQDQAALVE